jgi:hypothetical protein
VSGASGKRLKLLEDCRDLILQRLADVIAQALTRMSDELTTDALRSLRPEPQRALLDAVMLVREHRMEIEGRFRRSFADIFERRMFAMTAAAPGSGSGSGGSEGGSEGGAQAPELQLLSDEAIDDKINVDRLIGRARSRLDPDEVLGIRARLGELLEREWFDEARHPASPEAVFEALRTALAELSPRPEVKAALLRAFEPYVSENLNSIYATVNQRLRDQHVLPRIKQRVVTVGSARRGPDGAGAGVGAGAGAGARAGAAHGAGDASGWADGAAAVDGYATILDPVLALRQAMADASAGRRDGMAYVARLLRDPATFGIAEAPVSPVDQPLVEALTALQHDAGEVEGATLIPALVERVRAQGSPLDQITVEIVSVVFDYIYADRRLPDAIKQQLLRLQVVAVKAALLDRSFFARRQHPMRRLIDRITDVGADPDVDVSQGAPLVAGLTVVVDRVLHEFDNDLALFDRAAEEIDGLAREETERRAVHIESAAREAEAYEALAIAQDAAHEALGRLIDKDCPPFVRDFLTRRWADVLARLRTSREGEAAEHAWETGLRSAEYLVWSVAPKRTEDIPRLAAMLPGLICGLRQGLELVSIEPDECATFFDELLRAHTLEIAAAKRRVALLASTLEAAAAAPAQRPAPAAAVEPTPQPDAAARTGPETRTFASAPTASDELLSALVRGQRIEIDGDAGSRVFKLAWISPARKLFILTRHPDESLTLQGPELAFMFQREQARVAQQDSALDRAIGSVAGDSPRAVHADTAGSGQQPVADVATAH